MSLNITFNRYSIKIQKKQNKKKKEEKKTKAGQENRKA